MRVVSGKKIVLEIPVKFINHPDSPGLKRGGVLNIVRRTVELKCPAENIPNDITIDLTGTDIGTSLKISSVKLGENIVPTITDRDFVIATVAAPTIIKEPEKPAEGEAVEGSIFFPRWRLSAKSAHCRVPFAVSYTHLTLPTTPYV